MNEPETLDTGLLKSLFARLVQAAGRQDAAAARLGISRQRIGQLCSANVEHARDLPTWAQVWALEVAVERSVVFRALADMIEPSGRATSANPMSHAVGMVKEAADVLAAVESALEDGEVLPAEAEAVENELAQLEAKIAATRAAMRVTRLRVAS
jgi:DNA-binding transcriptional regulator YdaS (Cro superfamily)